MTLTQIRQRLLSLACLSLVTATSTPVLARSAKSACLAKAVSTVDIENCQQAALTDANARLNSTYRQKMNALSPERRQTLRAEERAWIAHRDQVCAVKPDNGTSGPTGAGDCLLAQTNARTRALQTMH